MLDPNSNRKEDPCQFREPGIEDAQKIYNLIERSGPLDLNSLYCYLLITDHFCKTSVVAERGINLVGFISAYMHPLKKDTIFVWQVAVDKELRKQGVAGKMLEHLISRPGLSTVSYLETTVNPSNQNSRALFDSFAKKLLAPYSTATLFPEGLFGDTGHEEEVLFRIGPFGSM